MSDFVSSHPEALAAADLRRRIRTLFDGRVPGAVANPAPPGPYARFQVVEGNPGATLSPRDLALMLSTVAHYHRSRAPDLPAHDPFPQIRRRLPLATRIPVREILLLRIPTGGATLQGNLHTGQFHIDESGRVWIADCDGMARGPAEADLADFTAHLATSPGEGGIDDWSARIRATWRTLGRDLDGGVFDLFLGLALVRRHLALREAGMPDLESEVLRYLRGCPGFPVR